MKVDAQALKLCLVTHRQNKSFDSYLDLILEAVDGGVTSIQLREKSADEAALLSMARTLKSILTPLNIPLIINDHIHIAHAVNAAGVHLGPHDVSPGEARALLGEEAWVGLSIETHDALILANQNPYINYVAASAVFETQTKRDYSTLWGLDGLHHFCEKSRHPVVAIGGINEANISLVKDCGVAGVAIVGAIHHAESPRLAAFSLREALESS
jgi:thiamine-phosphate pyrophosphorylase